jgi:hypothetical protein
MLNFRWTGGVAARRWTGAALRRRRHETEFKARWVPLLPRESAKKTFNVGKVYRSTGIFQKSFRVGRLAWIGPALDWPLSRGVECGGWPRKLSGLVPEVAESRGRSDCQKVSTYRDAVGGLRAADRMERSGHRRNGYFLARPALTGGSKFRSNFRQ